MIQEVLVLSVRRSKIQFTKGVLKKKLHSLGDSLCGMMVLNPELVSFVQVGR